MISKPACRAPCSFMEKSQLPIPDSPDDPGPIQFSLPFFLSPGAGSASLQLDVIQYQAAAERQQRRERSEYEARVLMRGVTGR